MRRGLVVVSLMLTFVAGSVVAGHASQPLGKHHAKSSPRKSAHTVPIKELRLLSRRTVCAPVTLHCLQEQLTKTAKFAVGLFRCMKWWKITQYPVASGSAGGYQYAQPDGTIIGTTGLDLTEQGDPVDFQMLTWVKGCKVTVPG